MTSCFWQKWFTFRRQKPQKFRIRDPIRGLLERSRSPSRISLAFTSNKCRPRSALSKLRLACHWMTVFGHPVLFDCLEKREDTASPKTPMQWHTTRTLSLGNTRDRVFFRRLNNVDFRAPNKTTLGCFLAKTAQRLCLSSCLRSFSSNRRYRLGSLLQAALVLAGRHRSIELSSGGFLLWSPSSEHGRSPGCPERFDRSG